MPETSPATITGAAARPATRPTKKVLRRQLVHLQQAFDAYRANVDHTITDLRKRISVLESIALDIDAGKCMDHDLFPF